MTTNLLTPPLTAVKDSMGFFLRLPLLCKRFCVDNPLWPNLCDLPIWTLLCGPFCVDPLVWIITCDPTVLTFLCSPSYVDTPV